MSTFRAFTLHPLTRKYQPAWHIDDYFGTHCYGVKFDGSRVVYDPVAFKMPTRKWPQGFNADADFAVAMRDLNDLYGKPSCSFAHPKNKLKKLIEWLFPRSLKSC